MIVYLSGPISLGGTLSEDAVRANTLRFKAARITLEDRGHDVYDPTTIQGGPDWKWETWMRFALRMMLQADTVVLLPGWHLSIGARIEVATAAAIMPIVTLDEMLAAMGRTE